LPVKPPPAPPAGPPNAEPPAAALDQGDAAILAQAAALRASGKEAWQEGLHSEAGELYSQACELLLMIGADGAPDEAGEAGATRGGGGPVAAELQKCRLSLSLCLSKQKRWRETVVACTQVIDANGRCGTAWFRRGQALEALGEAEAAAWDLQVASTLLPSNAQVRRALDRAQSARPLTKPRLGGAAAAASPFGDLFGSGGGGGDSPFGSLFGGASLTTSHPVDT